MGRSLLAHLFSWRDGIALITEHAEILDRRAEHFNSILNHATSISDDDIVHLPQVETNDALDNTSSVHEVEKAIKQLSCGKAPGSDTIPVEIYKARGPTVTQKLHELFLSFWVNGTLPQEFKDASIYISAKETGRAVATTEGSLSSALPERYSLNCTSVTSFYTSKKVFDQKGNAISVLVVVQLTWFLPLVNSRRNDKNNTTSICIIFVAKQRSLTVSVEYHG